MNRVRSAPEYDAAADLCVVTTYFNPCGYRSKRENYEMFRKSIVGSGLALVTVECVSGSSSFELPSAVDVLQIRTTDIMWQKERLLNLAIRQLPSRWDKVAWIDGDILFENRAWAVETSRALERFSVVQPFETAIRLPRGCRDDNGEGDRWRGFAAATSLNPEVVREGDYDRHGETGFAWTARRELIETTGLYEACIIGGADHAMAHALWGDWSSVCLDRLLGADNNHRRHFSNWAAAFYEQVRGEIGYVPGAALHLWHGERENRAYSRRHKELVRFNFDPHADLRIAQSGCWEWASDKSDMHRWAAEYFAGREEDGSRVDDGLSSACDPTSGIPSCLE